MSITMAATFKGKEGNGDAIIEWFNQSTAGITAADGMKFRRVYRSSENPDTILVIEEWESEEVHLALRQKKSKEREHTGQSSVGPLLAEPPVGVYHHLVSELIVE